MNLNQIVGITISLSAPGVSAPGFGVPLLMAYGPTWTERTRTYTDIDGIAQDFASTTATYLMAAKYLSQSPRPPKLVVGRCTSTPTQTWTVTVTVVADATVYEISDGVAVASYLSDGSATNDEIIAGLLAAINAISDTLTATSTGGSGSHVLVLTGNTAGSWDAIQVLRSDLMSIVQDNIEPVGTVAADLNAIRLENPNWYEIANPYSSALMTKAIADWVETDGNCMFGYTTQDTIVKSVADGSASDIAHVLKNASYRRTFGQYHPDNGAFTACAWAGRMLPSDPGSETWWGKPIATVALVPLNATELVNLRAKNCNFYTDTDGNGVARTFDGKVASGEWIDVVRFIDWLEANMRVDVVNALYALPKAPFDDDGIATVQGVILARLAAGVAVGGLVKGSTYCTVPKASSFTSDQRATRRLTGVKFGGQLAGAIQGADLAGSIVP